MPFRAVLYISVACLAESVFCRGRDEVAASVDALVEDARERNRLLDITGALIFTHRHFAQFLEGPRASVDLVMGSISCDPRHRDVMIVADDPAADRRFTDWTMAYAGPSQFAARQIDSILMSDARGNRARAVERLLWTMREFVAV